MRKKFKIIYPQDHHEPEKRGKPYKSNNVTVVMTGGGVFLHITSGFGFNVVKPLSEVLPKFDVVWKS